MTTVRTTMEPDREYEVTDREADDLRNQGLLMDEEDQPAEEKAPARSQTKDNKDKEGS